MSRLIPLLVIVFVLQGTACRRSTRSNLVASVQSSPTPSLTEFESTGNIDMYSEDYLRRSDGAIVRFGCQDRASASDALDYVHDRAFGAHLTSVTDASGTEIGKRFVSDARRKGEGEITWTEGARLFYMDGPSVQDVLTFEKSNVWKGSGCWDFRSLPPAPNKSLDRSHGQRVSHHHWSGAGAR